MTLHPAGAPTDLPIESVRWWDIAVACGLALFSLLAVAISRGPWEWVQPIVGNGVIALAYAVFGRPALLGRMPGWPFLLLATAGAMISASGEGSLAAVQAIVVPLAWMTAPTYRTGIAANAVVVAGVLAALLVTTPQGSWGWLILVQVLGLVFGIAIGTWITRIGEQSDQRQGLIEQLQATRGALEAMSLERGAAGERERIARDLHDTIAQDLTAIAMLAQRGRRGDDPQARLATVEEIAVSALGEVRALVASQAPVGLGGGLPAALKRLGDRFAAETGLAVAIDADDAPVPVDAEVVLLRVAQEGLANVRKHANAERAWIVLRGGDRPRLEVRDDGRGFDPASAPRGFGLEGMRERLVAAGGELEVSTAASGTTLVATLGGSTA